MVVGGWECVWSGFECVEWFRGGLGWFGGVFVGFVVVLNGLCWSDGKPEP